MSYQAGTKRARGGDFASLVQSAQVVLAIPSYATKVQVISALAGARYVVQATNAAVSPKTNTNMGWLVANVPAEMNIIQGHDNYLVLDNNATGTAAIYVTYFN